MCHNSWIIALSLIGLINALPWNSNDYGESSNFNYGNGNNRDNENYDNPFRNHNHNRYFNNFNTQDCNCVNIKSCTPLLNVLIKTLNFLPNDISNRMRHMACGYEGSEMKICCPFDSRNRRHSFDDDKVDERYGNRDKWVWDVEDHPEQRFSLHSRSHNHVPNESWEYYNFHQPPRRRGQKKRYLFHFEDPKSFKNCPPRISHEFELPEEFNGIKKIKMVTGQTELVSTEESVTSNVIDEPAGSTTEPVITSNRDLAIGLINTAMCGLSVNTRIIGGEDAGPGQFPWMARLAYRNITSQLISYRCSGSVISDQYVVTAAHCVTNLVDELEVVFIRLGELDSRTNLCNNSVLCSEPQDYAIDSIVHHLNYNIPKYSNDIALIRLHRPTNSTFIMPLCLPSGLYAVNDENIFGTSGIIAGWGATTRNNSLGSSILQWLRLPIVETTTCAASYARFSANSRDPIIVGDGQVCVQGQTNADACQGDSGGPLMSAGKPGAERYTLLGLVSFGPRTCGVSNFPGVYTRLSTYLDWILNNMTL